MIEEKQKIRKGILEKLRNQSAKEREKKSEIIREKVFALTQFQKAERIGFYASKEEEVDTWKIMREVSLFKKIALPSVVKEKLVFSYLRNLDELKRGVYGIYEPKNPLNVTNLDDLDLIIVPGVAFDLLNNRLGRGIGYYDQLLKKAGLIFKLGLGFDFQIVERLPVDSNDVAMDKVITD